MKKLITSIVLTLASALAFAITDAQKAEFINLIKSDVKGGAEFASTVETASKTQIAQTVGAWAKAEPIAFHAWMNSDAYSWQYRNGGIWVVRKAVNETFEAGSIQDAVINDYRATYDLACVDSSYYANVKSKGFIVVGGIKMTDWKIWELAKKYFDFNLIDTLPEKYVAERFGEYLAIIPKARLSSDVAYKLYSKISTNFAQYKDSVKAVKDNWEKLQNDKNEAFMQYYADQKLQNLNK